MRLLLVTGKGGVGKTSVAAATAQRLARDGHRTLAMSTDPAHSLADALARRVGPVPVPVGERLDAVQVDARERLAAQWSEVRGYLAALLQWGGVDAVEAEELAVLPGLDELLALLEVQRYVDAASHDAIVVDCAPTAETLRLLALPEALGWYLERGLGLGRPVVRALLDRVGSVPLPGDDVLAAVDRLQRALARVRATLLDSRRTTVRLVANPERVVVAETRRSHSVLHLFGYRVDAVVVNRMLPDGVTDPWFASWKQRQAACLDEVRTGFAGVPVLTAELLDDEAVGARALDRLADDVYGAADPAAMLADDEPLAFERVGARTRLRMALPLVARDELDLRAGDGELVVAVGGHVRRVALPDALDGAEVVTARLVDGVLEVDFAADRAAAAAGAEPARARSGDAAPATDPPLSRGA